MNDPYQVLGLPRTVTFPEVRARYLQLARKHHPDKLGNATDDERRKNEEYFQNVSVAYSKLEKEFSKDPSSTSASSPSSDYTKEDWRQIWAKVESMFQRQDVWDCMRQVIQNTISDAVSNNDKSVVKTIHKIKVPVTLEDIHNGKRKKLQLFLHGVKEPLRTHIDCKQYPEPREFTTCLDETNHTVMLEFDLQPHNVFRLDNIFGTPDLYVDVNLTWYDYMFGKQTSIQMLDGEQIDICVLPFDKIDTPKVLSGKGLGNQGNLYICFNIQYPSPENWSLLSSEDQQVLKTTLNALVHT